MRPVSNESSSIVRMLGQLQLPGCMGVELYPQHLQQQIDQLNDKVGVLVCVHLHQHLCVYACVCTCVGLCVWQYRWLCLHIVCLCIYLYGGGVFSG